jgi:hypothetical protein
MRVASVMVLLLGCSDVWTSSPWSDIPPVAEPIATAPSCQPARGLFVAGLTPEHRLRIAQPRGKAPDGYGSGHLVVDSTVIPDSWTPADDLSPELWSERTRAYPLPDGRSMIYDYYRTKLAVWDPHTKQLTTLGRGRLLVVPRLGWVLQTWDANRKTQLYDVDPDRTKPALRELWRGVRNKNEDGTIVGTLDAAPVVREGDALTCLTGAGTASPLAIDVPGGYSLADDDAFRDHRALVLAQLRANYDGHSGGTEIAVLDLDSGQLRHVGLGYDEWDATNPPYPMHHTWWLDRDPLPSPELELNYSSVTNVVDPRTEHLVCPTPYACADLMRADRDGRRI